jgi:hypothetical protein
MIQIVTKSSFIDSFRSHDRQDQFSYAGLVALFDWLEELESSTGEQIELDVVGLCCEFSEYGNLEDYNSEVNGGDYEDNDTMEDLIQKTIVIKIAESSSFIIKDY